jgi:hypothetical protein
VYVPIRFQAESKNFKVAQACMSFVQIFRLPHKNIGKDGKAGTAAIVCVIQIMKNNNKLVIFFI